MPEWTKKIREAARSLLKQDLVDCVIGFEMGTLPMRSTPCFVRNEEDVVRLLWNAFCETNLARYLPKRDERVAVVAKGCDTRAIVELIKEKQVSREKIKIIGVPCQGMVDGRWVEEQTGEKEIRGIEEKEGKILVEGEGYERSFDRNDVLFLSCRTCAHRNPVIYDILVGEEVEERDEEDFRDLDAFKTLPSDYRWKYFSAEFDRCIRCYACRNACPLCYCEECFVDCSQPQWVGRTNHPSDTAVFHLIRAFHLAGRCVACGACERACPEGVELGKLNRKMARDVRDMFGSRPGLDPEERAALATFSPDDPETFLITP